MRDHFITNFDKRLEPIYREGIEKWGKDFLYIKEDAYWCNGIKDDSISALWSKERADLSDFWRLMDELYGPRRYLNERNKELLGYEHAN